MKILIFLFDNKIMWLYNPGWRQRGSSDGHEPQARRDAEGGGRAEAAAEDERGGGAPPRRRDRAPAAAGADVAGGAGAEGEADHGPAAVRLALLSLLTLTYRYQLGQDHQQSYFVLLISMMNKKKEEWFRRKLQYHTGGAETCAYYEVLNFFNILNRYILIFS